MNKIVRALALLSISIGFPTPQAIIAEPGNRDTDLGLDHIISSALSNEQQEIVSTSDLGNTHTKVEFNCPPNMAEVEGTYCIDRWEATIIDKKTGNPASPHYTANYEEAQKQFQRFRELKIQLERVQEYLTRIKLHRTQQNTPLTPQELKELQENMTTMPPRGAEQLPSFEPMAVSLPNQIPASYVSRDVADLACKNAGKRLCSADEWYKACIGSQTFTPYFDKGEKVFPDAYPYGPSYEKDKCNIGLLKDSMWPPGILGRVNNLQMQDPRISRLVGLDAQPMVRLTGSFPDCVSSYGGYDMVGNMHEIVEDIRIIPDWNKRHLVEDLDSIPPLRKRATYMGAHFVRDARKSCGQLTNAHWLGYFDYSIGFRCCFPPKEGHEEGSADYLRPLPLSASSNTLFSVFATTYRISSTASGLALIESTP